MYKCANVLQWCKCVQQRKLEPPKDSAHCPGEQLAAEALKIAYSHRNRSWKDLESSLAGFRLALKGFYNDLTIEWERTEEHWLTEHGMSCDEVNENWETWASARDASE